MVQLKIAILLLFILVSKAAPSTIPVLTEREKVFEQIWKVAAMHNDERFFHYYSSILWNESRFVHNTYNVNIDGTTDYGIAQLNSRYFPRDKSYDGYSINTPEGNARVGALFYSKLVRSYNGDYYKATLAYNCGPGAVASGNIPKVTHKYAARVLLRAILSQAISRD